MEGLWDEDPFQKEFEAVTGDEKWIRYDNSKRKKSYGYPGHASASTANPN